MIIQQKVQGGVQPSPKGYLWGEPSRGCFLIFANLIRSLTSFYHFKKMYAFCISTQRIFSYIIMCLFSILTFHIKISSIGFINFVKNTRRGTCMVSIFWNLLKILIKSANKIFSHHYWNDSHFHWWGGNVYLYTR